jgi:hypothetical protein
LRWFHVPRIRRSEYAVTFCDASIARVYVAPSTRSSVAGSALPPLMMATAVR